MHPGRISVLLLMVIGASVSAQQVDSSRAGVWAEIFTRARLAQDAQDFRLAKTLYDSVIALDPRNSMAYMQRGFVNHNLADETASRADLEKAVALGNTQAASYLSGPANLAATPVDTMDPMKRADLLTTGAVTKLEQGDTTGALEDLQRARMLGGAKANDLYLLIVDRMGAAEAYRMNSHWYDRWLPRIPLALLLMVPFTIGLLIRQLLTSRGQAPVDELEPGETLLWSGVPKQSLHPNPRDVLGAVSGLFVGIGVAYVFGINAYTLRRIPSLFDLFAVVLVVGAAWQTVALYFNTLRDRKRSGYVVTDKRVLIARGRSYFIEHKIGDLVRVTLDVNRDGTGTLSATGAHAFFDHVPDARQVKKVIEDAHDAHVDRVRASHK